MKISILEEYRRRGKNIWFTVKFSELGKRTNNEGIAYDTSYGWGSALFIKDRLVVNKSEFSTHETFPVDEKEFTIEEIEKELNRSVVYEKVRKILK